MLISLIVLVMSQTMFTVYKWTKGNNSKIRQDSYCSSALYFHPMRSIYLQSFMLICLIVLELCPGQSSKCKNKQKAIILKLGKVELLFFCTAHLLNEIYLPTKFYVDISCCFKVMSWTRIADG
jgi:hypothetical protein